MKTRQRNSVSIILGLAAIAFTILLYFSNPEISASTIHWVLFTLLITITTSFGVPLGFGEVSLMPMVALSSTLVIGVIPTALAIIFADLLYGLIRGLLPGITKWSPEEDGYSLAATTTANITMHVFSVLLAGVVFYGLDGHIPLKSTVDFMIIVGAGAAYLSVNYILAGLFLLMRSKAHFRSLRRHLTRMLFYEAVPIAFAPLMALILSKLGLLPFIMVSLGLIFIANLLRDQAKNHEDLERRIQELSGLQAVGQSLTSSLDIHLISEAIYREVSKLMPASNFYLALWNPETDEVSFPAVYENYLRVESQSRTSKRGLTEYVIQNKKPLLIENNVKATVESLDLTHFGKEAQSWLGVPILAGPQAIGMIAVQSYPIPNQIRKTFDQNHQEILSTIAAQASVAIQNAWLYTQTDKALARHVQELHSILNTTSDGILLLNLELKVIEINQSLCNMLNIFPGTLINKSIPTDKDNPFSSLYIEPALLEILSDQSLKSQKNVVTLRGKVEIQAERTITPVQDKSGRITGWLCVYRDITEQLRLEKIQEDLTRMLVHDLRSPIVSIQGGLDMIEVMIEDNDPKALLDMVELSRNGCTRMLGMINQLLNVTQLEAGELTIQLKSVNFPAICEDESRRFSPIINREKLNLVQNFPTNFPTIRGDIELLRRVVHNIIDNATKYSPNGSKIEIWGKPDPQNSDYVLIGVKDQGPGIKENEHDFLFEKYFTSQQEKSRRRGTGLGLYFCKLAVEAHHGTIWVESKIGQGSNFIIRIPCRQGNEP